MITPLPDPPLRSDPANFSTKGDAFMAALPKFVTEANLLESNTQSSALSGTSTTSNSIGTGSKTFTTQASKAFSTSSYVMIVSSASPTNTMYGQVTSYNSGTGSLVVNVTQFTGSGTITSWNIAVSAPIPSIPDDLMDGGTTSGTSTAYTLSPTKPLTTYAANKSYNVTFNQASGNNPTLTISGLASPPNLVKRDYTGAYVNIVSGEISANWKSRVTLVSSTQALVEDLPAYNNILDTTRIDVASAATVNLTTLAPNTRHINITGTTTITAFTVPAGDCYFVRFNAALTLTNNTSIVTQRGANITTAAGDTCIIRATAANTVEVLSYVVGIPPAPSSNVTIGSTIATTTGTTYDFTGLSAIPNRFEIHFRQTDFSVGTNQLAIRLGTAGTPQTTGYLSSMGASSGAGTSASTVNALLDLNDDEPIIGKITITKLPGFEYQLTGMVRMGLTNTLSYLYSSVTLTGAMDIIRLYIPGGGSNTFNGGSVTISWE